MIDNATELFTAGTAIDAGLLESLKRGETKVTGEYTLDADGIVHFNQRKFVFNDRQGNLRVGKFKSDADLLNVGNRYATPAHKSIAANV